MPKASCLDDAMLFRYVSSNRIWADDHRRGVHYNLTDSADRTDHIESAITDAFRLAGALPFRPICRALRITSLAHRREPSVSIGRAC